MFTLLTKPDHLGRLPKGTHTCLDAGASTRSGRINPGLAPELRRYLPRSSGDPRGEP
jgi:hypothetical protein